MIYFIAEDSDYYKKSSLDDLCKAYKLNKIYTLPSVEEVKEILSEENAGIIGPSMPEKIDSIFANNSLFTIIRLPNRYGILTKSEYEIGMSEEEALSNKLGIKISKSPLTFDDMASADVLKGKAREMLNKIKTLRQPKGFMLIGLPGTGKSFFAKCLAGTIDYFLVELNLSLIMQRDNPIEDLNMLFGFFESSGEKYLVWIDEIEKMISSTDFRSMQVLGVLLTRLNEAKVDEFGKGSVISLATANNIEKLSKTTPELFRKGRFDEIIFLDVPNRTNAKEILKLHLKKESKHLRTLVLPYHFFGIFAKEFNIKVEYQNDKDYMTIVNAYKDVFEELFNQRALYFYKVAIGQDIDLDKVPLSESNILILKKYQEDINLGVFESRQSIEKFAFNIYREDIERSNNEKIKECIELYEKVFGFSAELIDSVVISAIKKYRGMGVGGSGRGDKFPYVHSEIEILALQLLMAKKKKMEELGNNDYENIKLDEVISEVMDELIPLQVALKKPLENMIGVTDMFLKG